MMLVRSTLILSLLFFLSCNSPKTKTLFSEAENTHIDFENKLTESKDFNVFKYRNFYNGGGVAVGDLNNDGLPDLFFTANQGANKLYLNKGNFQFDDVSEKAGFHNKKQWSTGVVFVDINNDGWLDIYVCNAGNMFEPELRRNQLFINNHDLTFTEKAKEYGLDFPDYTTQVSFFDYDNDGDLDCFVVNNSPIPVNTLNYANKRELLASQWQVPEFLRAGGDYLYKNDNGHFTDVTKEAGIHGSLISLGLGVNVADINNDGYPDIYVSNDFFERDYLYVNQKNGTFKDETENRIEHTSLASMGADIRDINNDGYPDIFTTDMLPDDDYRLKANSSFDNYDVFKLKQKQGFYNQFMQNALQVNNRNGNFSETAFFSGVAASDWSWGALMFDADNDGNNDIFVCNGIYRDVTDQDFIDFFGNDIVQQMAATGKKEDLNTIINKMPSNPIPNKFFHNKGGMKFQEEGKNFGLDKPSFSNGAVYADLDNDGDLDLVINNVNEKARVYKNNSEALGKNNYVAVSVLYKAPNVFGIGTAVKLFVKDKILSSEIIPSRGFQSSVDYVQTLGTGKEVVDSMHIIWPDQTYTTIVKPMMNARLQIDHAKSETKKYSYSETDKASALFAEVNNNFDKHTEDDYVDFYYERNIPFMLSRQGPKSAIGDVNGDKLDDIFIGGGKGQGGQLYLQTPAGFVKKENKDFAAFSFNDATAAVFFDCDNDGDLDLVTGGGGNFTQPEFGSFQNLLYINDGKGGFTLKRAALPPTNTNCGVVQIIDYNNDGKQDIFIASRSVPQNYGVDAPAFIFENTGGGNFKDVTVSVAPAFAKLGMITGAVYEDVNGDGKKDIITVGDWTTPRTFLSKGNKYVETKSGLENISGWWQTVIPADVDKDGDVDLILGNIGENFYLSASAEAPVKLWMKDFDQNGNIDKILTRTLNGKDIPVFTRREITDQIPGLKKQNLKHHEYANKTVEQLFPDQTKDAEIKQVNFVSSCIAYNNGKGQFTVKRLPSEVQLSSFNAAVVTDVNGDGYPDIVGGGNDFDLLPQFCRLDASRGFVLLNDGKSNYAYMQPNASGLNIKGEVKDVQHISVGSKEYVVFMRNDDKPIMYQLNKKK